MEIEMLHFCLLMHAHTRTHKRFMALWILSGTTQVSQYQKKHLLCHIYRGHQLSLTCFIWSATSFFFLTGHVSLPCNILLCAQLLYNLPLTGCDSWDWRWSN